MANKISDRILKIFNKIVPVVLGNPRSYYPNNLKMAQPPTQTPELTNQETTHTTPPDITMESLTQKMEELQASLSGLQGQHNSTETELPDINHQKGEDRPPIANIEEEEWNDMPEETESQDVMGDSGFPILDGATVSALYEGFRDAPIEGHPEQKEDFSLGQ